MKPEIEWLKPTDLCNHLDNIAIYGQEVDPEFVESVREKGVFAETPIAYVQRGEQKVVVEGHRRRQAAVIAKLKLVPCIRLVELEDDELSVVERLIDSNRQRVKTAMQLTNEAMKLKEIADLRRGLEEERPEGRVDEEIGRKLGVSSRTAKRAVAVATEIKAAQKSGDIPKAEAIKAELEKGSVASAYNLVKKQESEKSESPTNLGGHVAPQIEDDDLPPGVLPTVPAAKRVGGLVDELLGYFKSITNVIKKSLLTKELEVQQGAETIPVKHVLARVNECVANLKDNQYAEVCRYCMGTGKRVDNGRGCTVCHEHGYWSASTAKINQKK